MKKAHLSPVTSLQMSLTLVVGMLVVGTESNLMSVSSLTKLTVVCILPMFLTSLHILLMRVRSIRFGIVVDMGAGRAVASKDEKVLGAANAAPLQDEAGVGADEHAKAEPVVFPTREK